MMKISFPVAAAAIAVSLPLSALAQSQQIRPPIAVYWISAETAGGMGMDVPPGMGAMMPPGVMGGKRMRLELGSSQQPSGDAHAAHAIPPGLALGPKLPLLSPRGERAPAAREREEEPEFQRPKGRMLIYWGCGESVRPGQPVIVDFASLSAQDAARAFRSRSIARPRGPAPGRSRSFGTWPNQEDSRAVPAASSLVGEHAVSGNYSPEIRFAVDERHDFMGAVAFDPVRKTPASAFAVKWNAIPTATGYFATAMGQGEKENEVVTWSSSDVQEMGQVLMDYIPPAEVERLIREKVVMPPQTTQCSVPAGIFKSDAAMFNFIAYGNELNLVHPPRPQDPKKAWEQEWAVKLRLKSTGMTLLAEGEGATRRGGASPQRESDAPGRQSPQAETPQAPNPADAVQEGVKALRGLFGR